MISASSALAIGPSYQYILDPVAAGISTYNDVCSLTGNGVIGSGSVIGETIIPLNATQSVAQLNILTALHVAQAGVNMANFGAGPNAFDNAGNAQSYIAGIPAPLNGISKTYTLISPNNPNNLPEDLAIMQANITFNTAAPPAALTTILNNLVSPSSGFAANGGTAGAQSVPLTQSGYGVAGVWNGTAAAGTQYNLKGNLTDARRFQNNTSTSLIAPAVQTYFPCYQPFVTDAVLAPSATGTGVGIQGDSGGPWFTGGAAGAVTVTPKNPNDYNGANPPVIEPAGTAVGANTVIPVNYSNAESAEFVATAGFTTNSPQFAVPLLTFPQTVTLLGDPQNTYGNTQGSYEFVSSYAGINPKVAVPEPGIVSLAAAGSLALLRRRGRSVLGR